jgi:hypothetical protein
MAAIGRSNANAATAALAYSPSPGSDRSASGQLGTCPEKRDSISLAVARRFRARP